MMHEQALAFCRQTAVVPVLQLDDVDAGVNIARALFEGGLPILEITLRSPNAAAVLAAVVKRLPQAIIAAGSVLTIKQMQIAKDAGAKFAVSPGATDELLDANILPLLPGAQTASEVMHLSARGFSFAKFFPAVAAGGVTTLRAFSGPLPQMLFCPTGGIGENTAADFLALPNVICIGGSWLVPANGDLDVVYAKAKVAAQFKSVA